MRRDEEFNSIQTMRSEQSLTEHFGAFPCGDLILKGDKSRIEVNPCTPHVEVRRITQSPVKVTSTSERTRILEWGGHNKACVSPTPLIKASC